MDYPAIISATLGLSHPWHIVSVSFARDERRLDIRLDVFAGNSFTCPNCGKQKLPDAFEEEAWYHEDFFGYATYLNARVPRLECEAELVSVDRPWSRAGSRFSRQLHSGALVTVTLEISGEATPATVLASAPEENPAVVLTHKSPGRGVVDSKNG